MCMKIASLIVEPSFSPLHTMSSNRMSKDHRKMSPTHLTLKVGVNVLKLGKSNQIIGMQVLIVVHVNMSFLMSAIQLRIRSVSRPVKVPMTLHFPFSSNRNFHFKHYCTKNVNGIMQKMFSSYNNIPLKQLFSPACLKQICSQNHHHCKAIRNPELQ